jgi:glycosyltransferase involved in cell wall biosynthesis
MQPTPSSSGPALISIIVPVFNEAGTVRQVIDRLLQIPLPAPREIIVVNDGFHRRYETRARLAIAPVDGVLSIVHAAANGGKGSAIRIGLARARGTVVAIQDADLELDPVQLADLVLPILNGEAEVVYGSRFLAGRPSGPWLSIAANQLAHLADQRALRRPPDRHGNLLQDHGGACRTRSPARVEPFRHRAEITAKLLRQRCRIVERPVTFDPRSRASGKKIGWRDGVHAIAVLLKYRLQRF